MRIVLFIHSLAGGGAERVAVSLANYWATLGRSVTVITMASGVGDAYALDSSIERVSLGLDGTSGTFLKGVVQNVKRALALRKELRRIQPQIALGIMTSANVLLACAAYGMPALRTVGAEHVYPPRFPLGRVWEFLRRYSYAYLSGLTVLTEESAAWLKSHTKAKYVQVIPNAVSWPLPSLPPYVAPDTVLRPGKKILLAVGRFESQKGFDFLVKAFGEVAATDIEWDLVILGDGPLRPALSEQIGRAGLNDRILLPGWVGNIAAWYQSADLYVMTSRFEGFPNTLVEAMAHGLAAISFDCDTGPRDIIRHNVDGFLVTPGDVTALTENLLRLMHDDYLRAQFAQRAIEIRERYSLRRVGALWDRLFNEI